MIYVNTFVKNAYIKTYTLRTKQYSDCIWPTLTIHRVYVSTLSVLVSGYHDCDNAKILQNWFTKISTNNMIPILTYFVTAIWPS